MRIAIVTDAWEPQVNGVVTTYRQTRHELTAMGHEVRLITPEQFRTVPCPTYPSIRLALWPFAGLTRSLNAFQPDAVHVATEGPLGVAGRRWCIKNKRQFTTTFHTQFPEYVRMRAPIPLGFSYALVRRFHGAAVRTMVPTNKQKQALQARGFKNLVIWPRGVDTQLFMPLADKTLDLPRPVMVYMGRVAVEKNIEAFLKLQLPGSKLVIGDGPDLAKLKASYSDAHFTGQKLGQELADTLAQGDIMVFPSRTDTFGIVMLEAMACGLPIAAYPVTGPVDVVDHGRTGCLDEDLATAIRGALLLDPKQCIAEAQDRSWRRCTETFFSHLAF